MRGNIMRRAPTVEVAIKTKNAAQPAIEKKFRRLMRHIPWSSSGGRSCFGFLIAGGALTAAGAGFGTWGSVGGTEGTPAGFGAFEFSITAKMILVAEKVKKRKNIVKKSILVKHLPPPDSSR